MAYQYPTPYDLGVRILNLLQPKCFCAGFKHGLQGGKLNHPKFFRRSFRLGFRCAMLYLRQLRRQQGIIEFPFQGRIRFRVY